MPRGAQRGTEAVLDFSGARLADAKEVLVYYPGITVTNLAVVNPQQLKVTVKIAPDCRLGEHCFRVRASSGISEMHTFYVGALLAVEEKEPNNDLATAQPIPLNVTVHGVADNEDADYYRIEAKKGQRLTAEVEGMRLGTTMFDPYVAILDQKRFELATSDDAPLLGQDAVASTVAPADGVYYVQVRESSYAGNGACRYRLHVGTFPRPTAALPAGGKFGDEVTVRLLGDPSGEIQQKVKLPASQPVDKFGLFAQDTGGISPSAIPFRLVDYGNALEVEPNDTASQATKVGALPIALNGLIEKDGDIDFFRFTAKKGQTFDIHCYARRLGSPLDSVMVLYNGQGQAIASNDDAIGPDSYFRYTFPADGEYLISIHDHLKKGGINYFYRVEFAAIQPTVVAGLPKVDFFGYSQERQAISVPRGGRYGTLMSAGRRDCGGEVALSAVGLPQGVTMHCDPVLNGLEVTPVVFEAVPTAPVAGNLVNFKAKLTEPKTPFEGGFLQTVFLVAIPNRGVYWKHDLDRAAVAVTDEIPFKITLVEPKAPLVQNGSMNLKIVAERKPGFKGPITLQMLYNPPGVGSASSVVIAENQTEALYPINANGGALVRKHRIAVLGSSTVDGGPVWTSTQLATLEIAQPFLTFAMERAAVEQGKGTDLFCKVQLNTPFDGSAKVRLIGVPTKVTVNELDITKDTKEFAFKLGTDKTSPPGTHKNLFCQLILTKNGEPVVHNLGSSELRIDVPLPPKANTPPPAAQPQAAAKPAAAPPAEKRLTRLEKLRLEQEEREKAAKK
jgi:hypothetical protein